MNMDDEIQSNSTKIKYSFAVVYPSNIRTEDVLETAETSSRLFFNFVLNQAAHNVTGLRSEGTATLETIETSADALISKSVSSSKCYTKQFFTFIRLSSL